jgi:hypothetical protein
LHADIVGVAGIYCKRKILAVRCSPLNRCQAGALPRRRQTRRPFPIRASRLLLPRPRQHTREASLQPHPPPERLLGKNRKEVRSVATYGGAAVR